MIVCAAVKARSDGQVYCGKRHVDCLMKMDKMGIYSWPLTNDGVQGFVTDEGVFLDRVEAREHFIQSGQVPFLNGVFHHPRLLFSEDLY